MKLKKNCTKSGIIVVVVVIVIVVVVVVVVVVVFQPRNLPFGFRTKVRRHSAPPRLSQRLIARKKSI